VKERRRCDALREGKRFMVVATTERTKRQERVIKQHTRRRITVGNFVSIIQNKENTHTHGDGLSAAGHS